MLPEIVNIWTIFNEVNNKNCQQWSQILLTTQ